jgi:hypothetical protein
MASRTVYNWSPISGSCLNALTGPFTKTAADKAEADLINILLDVMVNVYDKKQLINVGPLKQFPAISYISTNSVKKILFISLTGTSSRQPLNLF